MCADRDANSTDEIEITPEMIEAGVSELCAYDHRFESMEGCVERIFTAMIALYPFDASIGPLVGSVLIWARVGISSF
jgi:hypothetical protein